MLLGIHPAVETDVAGWWADPRVMLSGGVWLVFAIYLYLQFGRGMGARTAARLGLVGAVLVLALFILARTVPVGFHVFAIPGA
jgi:ABC-type transport system involved in cytochrome c biogenesis permease subunit